MAHEIYIFRLGRMNRGLFFTTKEKQKFHVTRWNKRNGEFVELGDLICVLESHYLELEIVSTHAGILTYNNSINSIFVEGDIIATIS